MEKFLATLPVGYRFNPTDEELVNHYLFNKINNINLSDVENMTVPVCDLYGHQEPWELLAQNKFLSITGDLYCFTKLKKKPKSSRVSRSVGMGTWHGEDKGMTIDSNIEATKKRFNYRNKNSSHHCHWIMHEFSLLNVNTNWVLCRIRHNYASDDNGSPVKKRVLSKRKIREVDDQCVVYSKKRLKIDDQVGNQGFESDVGLVNSDMGLMTTDDEDFNSNDAAGILISELDNGSEVGFVNSDMGFKNTDEDFNSNDAGGILISELDNGSDVGFVNSDMGFKDTDDHQCLVYSERYDQVVEGFESDVGFVNSDMGFKTADGEDFNSNDAEGIVISAQDNGSEVGFVNLDMGFKTTDDHQCLVYSEMGLKIDDQFGNQGFESDVGFVNSDMGFMTNDPAGIFYSDLDNGFLGCHDLQGYGFIVNADHSEFDVDGEFPLIDCGSIDLAFSVDELFGYGQSLDQGDDGGISYSDFAS